MPSGIGVNVRNNCFNEFLKFMERARIDADELDRFHGPSNNPAPVNWQSRGLYDNYRWPNPDSRVDDFNSGTSMSEWGQHLTALVKHHRDHVIFEIGMWIVNSFGHTVLGPRDPPQTCAHRGCDIPVGHHDYIWMCENCSSFYHLLCLGDLFVTKIEITPSRITRDCEQCGTLLTPNRPNGIPLFVGRPESYSLGFRLRQRVKESWDLRDLLLFWRPGHPVFDPFYAWTPSDRPLQPPSRRAFGNTQRFTVQNRQTPVGASLPRRPLPPGPLPPPRPEEENFFGRNAGQRLLGSSAAMPDTALDRAIAASMVNPSQPNLEVTPLTAATRNLSRNIVTQLIRRANEWHRTDYDASRDFDTETVVDESEFPASAETPVTEDSDDATTVADEWEPSASAALPVIEEPIEEPTVFVSVPPHLRNRLASSTPAVAPSVAMPVPPLVSIPPHLRNRLASSTPAVASPAAMPVPPLVSIPPHLRNRLASSTPAVASLAAMPEPPLVSIPPHLRNRLASSTPAVAPSVAMPEPPLVSIPPHLRNRLASSTPAVAPSVAMPVPPLVSIPPHLRNRLASSTPAVASPAAMPVPPLVSIPPHLRNRLASSTPAVASLAAMPEPPLVSIPPHLRNRLASSTPAVASSSAMAPPSAPVTLTRVVASPAAMPVPPPSASYPADWLVWNRPSDGRLVRLCCPVCQTGSFRNHAGFVAHCRLRHGRTFDNVDEAAEAYGVLVEGLHTWTSPDTGITHTEGGRGARQRRRQRRHGGA